MRIHIKATWGAQTERESTWRVSLETNAICSSLRPLFWAAHMKKRVSVTQVRVHTHIHTATHTHIYLTQRSPLEFIYTFHYITIFGELLTNDKESLWRNKSTGRGFLTSIWNRGKEILYMDGSVHEVSHTNPKFRVWGQWHWVIW